jgi:hypothetical protein
MKYKRPVINTSLKNPHAQKRMRSVAEFIEVEEQIMISENSSMNNSSLRKRPKYPLKTATHHLTQKCTHESELYCTFNKG